MLHYSGCGYVCVYGGVSTGKGETDHMKDCLGVSPYGPGVNWGGGWWMDRGMEEGNEKKKKRGEGHSDVMRPQCLQDAKKAAVSDNPLPLKP